MFGFLKQLGRPKEAPTCRDSLFGLLTRSGSGVWRGELPFRNYHVKVLLPGAEFQPTATRLALARSLMPDIQAKVDSALDYAAEVDPKKLWRGKLLFYALNLVADGGADGFTLDFVATGDLSDKCWQVRFDGGKPVQVEYVPRVS